jgi:hypothetical protein
VVLIISEHNRCLEKMKPKNLSIKQRMRGKSISSHPSASMMEEPGLFEK